jgi:hypothetical protein
VQQAHSGIIHRNSDSRSLVGLSGRISSSRLLNLHQLWLDQPSDREYETKPLFSHPVLNRAIIVKFNIQVGEESNNGRPKIGATKVMLPLDIDDLNLGAQYLVVGDENFVPLLSRSLDYTGLSMDRDLSLLRILDHLPSLDPFLLDQMARHYQMPVARCYFRMNQCDIVRMQDFVLNEMEPLIRLCLGVDSGLKSRVVTDSGQRLSNVLISDGENLEALSILREGLRMQPMEFSKAIFGWKALLFYKWRLSTLARPVRKVASSINNIRPMKGGGMLNTYIDRARNDLSTAIIQAWTECAEIIKEYNTVYDALVQEQRPDQFRRFLSSTPELFISLGDRVGRLSDVTTFWDEQFGEMPSKADPEQLCAALIELERTLATKVSFSSFAAASVILRQDSSMEVDSIANTQAAQHWFQSAFG